RDHDRTFEETQDVVDDIDRRVDLAPVMHDDRGRLRPSNNLRHAGIALQAPDVVDDRRAKPCRLTGDTRLGRVDRDRHRDPTGERLDDRRDPREFVFLAYRREARPRGFSAYIDDGSALAFHRQGTSDGGVARIVLPAVGKGVGRHIEDTHEDRRLSYGGEEI